MDIQFRSRNHDLGQFVPTFQERINSMLPVSQSASAAEELKHAPKNNITPHYPTNDEIAETLAQVEMDARNRSEELIQMHAGLNEDRVSRLLGLLD